MKRLENVATVRERERERESRNLKTIEPKTKLSQKPNNQKPAPNNKLFDVNYDVTKTLTKNNTCRGDAICDLDALKHKTKPTSNVPTSNFQHPTSSTAITLVALVITIIVLLILAAITLTSIIGENGIINKAIKAREETKANAVAEELELILTEAQTQIITEGRNLDIQEIAKQIQKDQNEKIEMIITYMPEAKVTIISREVTDNRRSFRTNSSCRNRL